MESEILGGPHGQGRVCRRDDTPDGSPAPGDRAAAGCGPVRSPAMHDEAADPIARFRWHPEPELLGIGDEATSRAALEHLGTLAWQTSLDYLYREGVRRGTGPETYPELRERYFGATGWPGPAPAAPTPSGAILAEFTARLAPYQLNPYHPGVLSYFTPPPLALSIVGELLGQWINQGIDVYQAGPVGTFVEEEVNRWLCDLVGYPHESWGVLTSGGTMANLMALTVVRDVHLGRVLAAAAAGLPATAALDPASLAARGGTADPPVPRGAALEGVRVYASDQAHFSIAKALDILGFPEDTLHVVPSDARFRLRGADVAGAIAADVAAGLRPLAVAAVAGSTNTGAVDATGELADVAAANGLWLHVDAAYGGAALLSARDAARVPDLARADSITIDPHKWFFQAYDIGGLLVRRQGDLRHTFHREPEYYRHGHRGEDPIHWHQYSFEGTRRFRALKLWASWKHLGTAGFGRLVEMNDDLAAHLAARIDESDDLDAIPAGAPDLSVICFRHLPGGRARAEALEASDPGFLDRYTDLLCAALNRSGEGWLSTTILRGRTYLRAGIVNYLSSPAAVDKVLVTLRRLASVAADAARIPPA
jgi:aromatic-L-amino-acid decarboxylase